MYRNGFSFGTKKLISAALAAVLAFSLTACTGAASETSASLSVRAADKNEPSQTVTSETSTETSTEASTVTSAETSTEVSAETSNQTSTEVSMESKNASDTSQYLDYPVKLADEWLADQDFKLADPAPWNLKELKQVVDVHDPRSVAAYFVWAVNRLTDDYDGGMEMMKYLFADIEPFGSGFTEGGGAGRAGWDTYFNERLKDTTYSWLPRAYFNGASKDNGFKPDRPLTLELYYNKTNTETINGQTLDQLGRLNIVYWVKSYVAGNQVNIELSRFDGSDRWYVTKGSVSSALFYQQSGAGTNKAKEIPNDDSTQAEHETFYGK